MVSKRERHDDDRSERDARGGGKTGFRGHARGGQGSGTEEKVKNRVNEKRLIMQIERDFTSGNVTLAFESNRRMELTKDETYEFDKRMKEIQEDARKEE